MKRPSISLLRRACCVLLLLAGCCWPVPERRDAGPLPVARPVRVRLLFGGDVMQHLSQVRAARRGDGFDYAATFAAVAPRFRQADLAVVNLETTLADREPYTGYPLFRSPAALADALRDAGIDVALLANNHCLDGGRTGVLTTLRELDRCRIAHTGLVVDSTGLRAGGPLLLSCRGVRIALLNYTYGTNGIPDPSGVTVSRIDTLRMAVDLAEARRAGSDCIAVCIHWGNEYERHPDTAQRRLARFLRRHGADLVVGSHPHVVQPCEFDSTHAVFYSLGNLVSNQRKRYCDGGLLAEVEVTKHPEGRMSYAVQTVPVWVSLPGYRILPPEAAGSEAVDPAWRLFLEDTEQLLGE